MPKVTVINPHSALETAPPVNVNGTSHPIAYGKVIDLPEAVIEALRNSSFTVIEHDEPEAADEAAAEPEPTDETITTSPASDGNGDAAGGAEPGGEAPAGSETPADPDFDPEAVIKGTVPDVEAALANLTADQLAAVEAAELDREQPRAGVAKAIAHARAAFAGPDA